MINFFSYMTILILYILCVFQFVLLIVIKSFWGFSTYIEVKINVLNLNNTANREDINEKKYSPCNTLFNLNEY